MTKIIRKTTAIKKRDKENFLSEKTQEHQLLHKQLNVDKQNPNNRENLRTSTKLGV